MMTFLYIVLFSAAIILLGTVAYDFECQGAASIDARNKKKQIEQEKKNKK